MSRTLRVSLNRLPVGTLTQLPGGGIFFAFDEGYLNMADRPVLSQSFFRPSGEIIPDSMSSSSTLPAFFSNLLPEGHMREYLAKLGGLKPSNEFQLIGLLGQDLPGAVIITPAEGVAADRVSVEETEPDNNPHPLRFSLAGVQLKFSAVMARQGGLTIPASGVGGNWIVKLPAHNYPNVPENEFAMMHLASLAGIPVPETKLIPLSDIGNLPEMGVLAGKQALAVKRFDRSPSLHGETRIHIEDFAQVFNVRPGKKYEGVSYAGIAAAVWQLTGEGGLRDFIRRLTFCILIGNGDMHLKNWSLIYEDGKTPALAPAYDLLSTVPYIPQDGLALNLSGTKDMRLIDREHFRQLAKRAQVPEFVVLQTVGDTVDATYAAWTENSGHYDLPPDIRNAIGKHMDGLILKQ